MSTGNINPSAEEIKAFILRQVRRIQPCSFGELMDVTGFPTEVLVNHLDKMLASKALMTTKGVNRVYFSIYKEVRL